MVNTIAADSLEMQGTRASADIGIDLALLEYSSFNARRVNGLLQLTGNLSA